MTIALPIASFVRARRAERTAEEALRRLAAIEARLSTAPPYPEPRASALPASPGADPLVPPVHTSPVSQAAADAPVTPPRPYVTADVSARPNPSPAATAVSLEQLIGGRWLLYLGVAAVILGVSYFVKFAFDNGWISEHLRVASGLAVGALLIAAGIRFDARGVALFGQALAGGGVVVLYVSIYAALHFYTLVGQGSAFAAMIGVTMVGAWLADRHRAQPLAMLALTGGFATPLLVGGERGSQTVLFTYIAILIAGAVVLSRRHAWPVLIATSYVGTFALVVVWALSSYEAADWLRTHLFLTAYAVTFAYLLHRLVSDPNRSGAAQLAGAALATSPLVYHLASIALLSPHHGPWLTYLVLSTAAVLAISRAARLTWLRLLGLVVIGAPAAIWLSTLDRPAWYWPAVAVMTAVYAFHLTVEWEDGGRPERLPAIEALHLHLNGLLLPAALYVFFETRFAWINPWMTGTLAAWNAAVALAAGSQRTALAPHHLALSATLAAITLVLAFDGPVVPAGWAVEGAALAWMALRDRSRGLGAVAGVLMALGCVQMLRILTGPSDIHAWAIFNARALAALIIIASLSALAWRMRADPSEPVRGDARTVVIVSANVVAIALLSTEILSFFDRRAYEAVAADAGRAALAAERLGQVVLSVAWAIYAVALIAAGMRRGYPPARYFGIVLFAVTVLKVMTRDISELDRVDRMFSVLGVGVLLLVASYLYQRMAGTQTN